MELRMNPSPDEYEEVESPFASKSSDRPPRERLRSRKNVFNRPFATESTHAPTYIETTATRKSIGGPNDNEFVGRRRSSLEETEIEYLNEEEQEEEQEILETRPARTNSFSKKKKEKSKINILSKLGWSVIGILVLRLIFMDRGVWDYFSTERDIKEKRDEFKSIQRENTDLKSEISRIQLDRNYQKQLAKEHLGVIAVDEFLILFAGEASESSTSSAASL